MVWHRDFCLSLSGSVGPSIPLQNGSGNDGKCGTTSPHYCRRCIATLKFVRYNEQNVRFENFRVHKGGMKLRFCNIMFVKKN